jgi:hypothetical protein
MPYFKNENINVLFIHIPKTGGTSVDNYFSFKYNIKLNMNSLHVTTLNKKIIINKNTIFYNSPQHLSYQMIMKNKDFFKIDTNNLNIFTIVRNPYERIISDLFFFKEISIH